MNLYALIIYPVLGFSAALTMGIHEDIGLLVAGIAVTSMAIIRDRKSPDAESSAAQVA